MLNFIAIVYCLRHSADSVYNIYQEMYHHVSHIMVGIILLLLYCNQMGTNGQTTTGRLISTVKLELLKRGSELRTSSLLVINAAPHQNCLGRSEKPTCTFARERRESIYRKGNYKGDFRWEAFR